MPENQQKLAAAKAKYQQHKGCWPLIRFQLNARAVAGAFQATQGEEVASDPCEAAVDADGNSIDCEETQGELWIPASCEQPPAESETEVDVDDDLVKVAAEAESTPVEENRRRAVLADDDMANAIVTVLATDAGQSFTVEDDADVNPMAEDVTVAVDDVLADHVTCDDAPGGINGNVEKCAELEAPYEQITTDAPTGTDTVGTPASAVVIATTSVFAAIVLAF